MSSEFTVALCAPDRPVGQLLTAIEVALVDRVGLFEVFGTTAGYRVLVNRQLEKWLGG
jgi:hypothetical protein